jgi:hypothetical protein
MGAKLKFAGITLVDETKGNSLYGTLTYSYQAAKQNIISEAVVGAYGTIDKVISISYPRWVFSVTWYIDRSDGVTALFNAIRTASMQTGRGRLELSGTIIANAAWLLDIGQLEVRMDKSRGTFVATATLTFQEEG